MADVAQPRGFVSYAWTSAEHQDWVVSLATRLRGDGVDIVLDVWDLRPGQDKYHFMEGMVRDRSIEFVLMLCNAKYAEKANSRSGGVGDETLIITPEIYASASNEKFIPVVVERDDSGEAFIPTYLKSRIYIDLSSEHLYEEQYEKLIRLLHGAPEYPKPQLGKKPAFLEPDADVGSTTRPQLKRALNALEQGKPIARIWAAAHLEAVAGQILALRVAGDHAPLDEQLVEAIRRSKHLRDEPLELFRVAVGTLPSDASEKLLVDFLQTLLSGCYPQSGGVEHTLEAVRFVTTELFLYIVADLLNSDQLIVLENLLAEHFIVDEHGARRAEAFEALWFPFECIDKRRNQRLQQNRTSHAADLLHERADRPKTPFDRLQEADFLLYLRSKFGDEEGHWWPRTLIHRNSYTQAFDIFMAPGSRRHDARLQAMLGSSDRGELQAKLESLEPHNQSLRFNYQHIPMSVARMMNLERR